MIELTTIEAKSDQMNAVDFVKPIVFQIDKVDYFPKQQQQNVHLHFKGYQGRPYKPCKSMLRGLCKVWTMDEQSWVGKKIELFCNPSVKWAGENAGGIRISAVSGISEPFELVVQLNRKQREIQTWAVISDDKEVKAEFVATHFIQDIEESKSDQQIDTILKKVKKSFGADAQLQLKDAVIAARAKFSNTDKESGK